MQFIIKGTHCPACKKLIEKRVGKIVGVTSVNVNFETGETKITAVRTVSKDEIKKALENMEYIVV